MSDGRVFQVSVVLDTSAWKFLASAETIDEKINEQIHNCITASPYFIPGVSRLIKIEEEITNSYTYYFQNL